MWRVKFIYFHPVVELEDECILDFNSDLDAWRFYQDALNRYPNIIACYKPFKVY